MFKKAFVLVVSLIPLSSFGAGKPLTLEAAVAQVLSHNPDIQAAGSRVQAAKAKIPQAKSLEDPMVGVRFYNVPIDTIDIQKGMEIDYMVQQKIPFPGKRHVRGKVARLDAGAMGEAERAKVQDVLLDLKKTWYDVWRLDRSLEVNRENQKILKLFLGSAETAYAAGKGSAEAPLKAKVELSKLANEGLLLEQERVTHLSHLKAVLNRSSHGEIRLPSEIRWPQLRRTNEEVQAMALAARPELAMLKESEKRDRSRLTVARQGLVPDLSLGFEYVQRPMEKDAWTGQAMVNLPIFFWKRNRGEIREAKASLRATEAENRSMQIHTRHEIDQAWSAVKTAEKLVATYQGEILPQAKANLEVARLAYTTNKVDFLTLIDAARTYKELQMSFYENQMRLGDSFAELERLVGRDL